MEKKKEDKELSRPMEPTLTILQAIIIMSKRESKQKKESLLSWPSKKSTPKNKSKRNCNSKKTSLKESQIKIKMSKDKRKKKGKSKDNRSSSNKAHRPM